MQVLSVVFHFHVSFLLIGTFCTVFASYKRVSLNFDLLDVQVFPCLFFGLTRSMSEEISLTSTTLKNITPSFEKKFPHHSQAC